MATTLNYKDYYDLPMWRPEAPAIASSAAGGSFAWDMRNGTNGSPYLYFLRSSTNLDVYDPITGDWMALASPALAGTFGAGATAIFHPSQGPRGAVSLRTVDYISPGVSLGASIGVNQLANRGDGTGFRIRVIGNGAGSSGKIEERTIIANTGGTTTPTMWFDTPLSFTPSISDTFEIRSGRVFLLGAGVTAAGTFKYYDIATNSFSGNLSTTNLPGTIGTDSNGLALSESHVPHNRSPGEGFVSGAGTYDGGKNCIVATATSATTITGAGMFTDLQANEYTNFQVRIVEDVTTPTAVNQRRRIASHTAGATGVFTVATWAVTPSATAKFVIENDDDRLIVRSTAATAVYNYNITANTWDTTSWGAAVAHGAGVVLEQSFGITRDIGANARHSNIFCIRGGGSAAIDVLNIAAAATGTWTNDIPYGKKNQTFTTGTVGAYDPATKEGRLMHICINGTQRMAKFDMKNRILDAGSYLRYPQGTALVGQKIANGLFIDGATKSNFLYLLTGSQPQMFSNVIQ
jgi:hypothetical protein